MFSTPTTWMTKNNKENLNPAIEVFFLFSPADSLIVHAQKRLFLHGTTFFVLSYQKLDDEASSRLAMIRKRATPHGIAL